jgi:hypothetical protein
MTNPSDPPTGATGSEPPALSDADRLAIMARCSNQGRWGADDQLGTLNLITDEVRRRAVATVRHGATVSLGRPLPVGGSTVAAHPVVHQMLAAANDAAALDSVLITNHDPQLTHVDALGHTYLDGQAYNGRDRASVWSPTGLNALSVASLRGGIVGRGVLLDIAAARGVDYLAADQYVMPADLDAAARHAGVTVGAGDVVVVHVGRAERLRAENLTDFPVPRAGLHISAVPWLHAHDVAVFLGDCTERLPAEPPPLPLPLHQIGSVAMGLCLIDGALTSELVATCARLGSYEFLFCCTIPELPGGTGFAVNPVCVF